MRRWLPHPILTPALAVLWLLLNNTLAPGHVVLGTLLGWTIPLATRRFWPETVRIRAPGRALRLTGSVLLEIVVANLSVARLILAGPTRLRPAFVVVPLALEKDIAISLLANIICLTPGTVSARLTDDRRHLIVHALDAPSPEAVIASIKADFEAPLKEIFEC